MSATVSFGGSAPARLLIGTGVSTSAGPGSDPVRAALEAEARGYDFISASDHPVGDHPTYETLTMLTWIAARTQHLQIATRVLGVPFRRPGMIAKTAESLHRLSGGRLILGLGGGHSDSEIRALGIDAYPPRDKVDGMSEAIDIMRGVWSGPSLTYSGRIHRADGLTIEPRPATPIPIWLGTYGRRALAVTGRAADGWIPSLGFLPPADVPDCLDRIRAAAQEAGRAADAVRAICNVSVEIAPAGRPENDIVRGCVRDIVEQLAAFVDLGFTGFNLMPSAGQERRIAEELLPELRRLSL